MNDPLWQHSPGKRWVFRLACYGLVLLLAALLGRAASGSQWGALATAAGVLCLLVAATQILPRLFGRLGNALRWRQWRRREGVHLSFAGVSLDLHDDGQRVWLHERGVRRLLELQRDPEPAFKARFAGQWREARELGLAGRSLWLNAQDVHRHLGEAAGRMDPRRVRLRAYLDREILRPAARRRG